MLVVILLLTFVVTRMAPGDFCYVLLGERATEATCNHSKLRFRLNKRISENYALCHYSCAVLTEMIFSLSGVGCYVLEEILQRIYSPASGSVLNHHNHCGSMNENRWAAAQVLISRTNF